MFGLFLSFLLLCTLIGVIVLMYFVRNPLPSLPEAIEITSIMKHLKNFETIAFNHPKQSRSVENAFNESVSYVSGVLKQRVGSNPAWRIWNQTFPVPIFEQISVPQINQVFPKYLPYQNGVDFVQLRYGGNVVMEETLDVVFIDVGETTGCRLEDYKNVTNQIVIIPNWPISTSCEVYFKALYAQRAGAKAVLIANRFASSTLLASRVLYSNWSSSVEMVNIPVFGISYTMSESIKLTNGGVSLKLIVNCQIRMVNTLNLFVERIGSNDTEIMVGAHLDSVPEGPGINDNASGVSTILEIFNQIVNLAISSKYTIRFAFWGAEEIGLLGSRYYVQNHPNPSVIVFYLNYDMLGSPNFMRGVHDGNTAQNAAIRIPSARVSTYFVDYFNSTKKPCSLVQMESGSDFVPFASASIPTGGIKTGAGIKKSVNERTLYGGFAHAAFDPCYHESCDTVDNINSVVLEELAKASAKLIEYLIGHSNVRMFFSRE
jgi:hypothetical protein